MFLFKPFRSAILPAIMVGGMLFSCKPESGNPPVPKTEPIEEAKRVKPQPKNSSASRAQSLDRPANWKFSPPQITTPLQEIVLFEYVDSQGAVHKTDKLDLIPQKSRAQVRIITSKALTTSTPYVADLRTKPDPVKAARVPKYPPEKATHAGMERFKIPNKRPGTKRKVSKRKPVVIYVDPNCKDCDEALKWLKQNKIKTTEKSFKANKTEATNMCKRHGKLCVRPPILLVGGALMTHYNAKMLDALTRN